MHTLAVVAAESPAVEWALDAVAFNLTAHAQAGAHVWAVGVDHVGGAGGVAKYGQLQT